MGWAIFTAGVAAALAYGLLWSRELGPRPLWGAVLKASALACFALAGLLLQSPAPIVWGLALGAVGDFALARRGERWFLAGMAAFAAGHLAYALAFLQMGTTWPPLWVVVWLLLLAASTEWWLAPHTGALRWPVRGYIVVICVMAALAAGLPGWMWLLQAGAALFVLSDTLLAADLFAVRDKQKRRVLGWMVWAAYACGQALILIGSL